MAASSSTAVSNAIAQVNSASRDWSGWCLIFVRSCLGIPAGARTAFDAWNAAKTKHTTGVPPAGVPVFWHGGSKGYGHIALSAGGGYVYSTDILRRGKVDRVTIGTIKARWGQTYLGWSLDLNGVSIALPGQQTTPSAVKPAPTISVSLKALMYSARNPGQYLPNGTDDVVNVKGYLVRHNYAAAKDSFATAYAKYQRALGYRGTNADGVPGMKTLTALCRSANWKIVA